MSTGQVDLEKRGEGYAVYRIPALTITTKGTLIAAYDGRPSMADVPSNIALLVRRSRDEGRTWTARQVVRADTAPRGFGDPSLLVDRTTGRIFLFHVASVNRGFAQSATGLNEHDPDVLQADYSWSDDDGVTWHHRRITSSIKNAAWGGIFASSGQGIQLRHGAHAGRLIQQYVIRRSSSNYAASAYSDDQGETWQMGELVGPGVDENKVVELSDGRVMLNSRAKPFRLVATSSDGGRTYGALHPDRQLVDPGNNGAIVRAAPDVRDASARSHRVLFSNTADSTQRRNLTVRMSCDDGSSWPTSIVAEAGGAGYSTMVMLRNGDVGLLYERGPYEYITFARVSPQWAANCK